MEIGRAYHEVDGYCYGFNGMEKDDEVAGSGNSLDFGARMYDSRVARFLSIDPKSAEFSFMSPYSFAANNPIYFTDKNGESPEPLHKDNPLLYQLAYGYHLLDKAIDEKWNLFDRKWYSMHRSASHLNMTTAYFNTFSMDVAVRNLNRYAEGKGGYDIFSFHDLRKMGQFNDLNKSYRNNSVTGIKNEANRYAQEVINGDRSPGTYEISGSWRETMKEQNPGGHFKFAFGRATFLGSYNGSVTIDENGNYTFDVTLRITMVDIYDFSPENYEGIKKLPHVLTGSLTHQEAVDLKEVGAADFVIRAYYQYTLSGDSNTNRYISSDGQDSMNESSNPEVTTGSTSISNQTLIYDGRREQ